MKAKTRNRELNLISVFVNNISEKRNPKFIYNSAKEIVPQIAIDAVEVLTNEIIEIMPVEALSYYFSERKSLITFAVSYNNSGEYSIIVDSAFAIIETFHKEIDEIFEMLDKAIICF